MPYKSQAQRRWAHTAAGKKALGGEAGVHEWDEATKGKKLPEKVEKSLPNPSAPKNNFNTISTQLAPSKFSLNKSPKQPKNIALTGKQSVTAKTPKLKSAPDPFAPPSKYFEKSEEIQGLKHKNLKSLWDFVSKKHKK